MKFVVVILDMVLFALGFWFSVNYFLQEPIMLRLLGTIIWMITVMFVQQIICKLWLWEPAKTAGPYPFWHMLIYSLAMIAVPVLGCWITSSMIVGSDSIMGDPFHPSVSYVGSPDLNYVVLGTCILGVILIVARIKHLFKKMHEQTK